MAAQTGRFKDGKKKGWRWEIYQDPASPTGWTRKIWDPKDASNGGRPTEYFEAHDFEADLEDAREAAATVAARTASRAAQVRNRAAAEDSVSRERDYEEDRAYRYKDLDRESLERRGREDRESREREAKADRKQRLKEIELRLGEDRRQFDLRYGLDRDELGLGILRTAASLRGPDDLVQGWAFAQGAADTGLSPYLQAIRGGTATAYGGGTAREGNPAPVTVGSLANQMSGQGYGTDAYGRPRLAPEKQQFVDDVARQFREGLANKPLGYFENMTGGQRKGFFSAGAYAGEDTDAGYEYYQRSRPGQRSALLG